MRTTDTVIIGAGHAGLAMSWCLSDRGVEHVVIERGRLGERWRTARWDSFRLLTPNWMSRLPGHRHTGPDPDGFMTAGEFVDYLVGYAQSFAAPVRERTTVIAVRSAPGGYTVQTDQGEWAARSVVIATGYHATARRPAGAERLAPDVAQLTPAGYRNPAQLPDGGVLVVGASASGAQIADELAQAGRRVTLAVGRHTRLPRRYRDRDILWWLERTGALDRTLADLPPDRRTRPEPSMQLVGRPEPLDLATLRDRGVRLTGRLVGIDATTVRFADDLLESVAEADHRLYRLLGRIDRFAESALPGRVPGPAPVAPVDAPRGPRRIDLRRAGISSVVWATGYRPWYPWLRVPVLDDDGRLRHQRGVTPAAGLFAIGLRFQHRRSSTFIDGARHDATYLTDRILDHLHGSRPAPTRPRSDHDQLVRH
jgi:putative flavoprotein involved in K+ transport